MNRAVRGGGVAKSDGTVVNYADGLDSQGRQIISGGKATSAIVITADEDIEPTEAVMVNVDTDVTMLFEGDETPIQIKLLAGIAYPFSIVKVTVGTGVIGLY